MSPKERARICRGGGPGNTSGMPPELVEAAEAMLQKMQQMVQKAQRHIADNPVDAETMRQIEGMFGKFDDE
jgi:CHASE3 domain sensor protein